MRLLAPDGSTPPHGLALGPVLVAEHRIRVPWRRGVAEFADLALPITLVAPAHFGLSVRAIRGGQRSDAARVAFSGDAGEHFARLPLPRVDALDALEIVLDGEPSSGVAFGAPVLEYAAPKEIAPLIAEGAAPMRPTFTGGDSRFACALLPGWRAIARTSAPAARCKLRIDFGVVSIVRGAAQDFALRATLRQGSAQARVLRANATPGGAWSTIATELRTEAGELLEIELELECPRDAWGIAAVSAPDLYEPVDAPATVVFVTSDTHRGDHVEGVPDAVEIRTPALVELAARGVVFTDCYSSTNITVPSHVALLAGLHPRVTGVTDNDTQLADVPGLLPEVFRAAGFRTLAVTSLNLLSSPHANLGQGFDRMSWPQQHTRTADRSVDIALRWLEEERDRPVFLWLHVFDAHGPYEPPPPFVRAFYPRDKNPADPSLAMESGMRVPDYLPGVRDADFIRALYGGEIGYVDQQLGRLLGAPRVRGGITAVTGDHGEVLGRHGIWWAHKDVYPDTLHVPLILAWPGAPAGERIATPVENVDVGRTLLDLAELRASTFPGRDLFASERERASTPRFALSDSRFAAAINTGRWHLILQLAQHADGERPTRRALHAVELYDLEHDAACEHDLSASEPAKTKELRAQLVDWLLGWRGERMAARRHTDPATLKELAQLGYASDAIRAPGDAPLIDASCACAQCARLR